MLIAYLLAFCRLALILVFLLSSIGKARDLTSFERAIAGFQILPRSLAVAAAWLFLAAEAAVVALLIEGALLPGFALALVLLLAFSAALASALYQRLPASCNCFGSSKQSLSRFDLWRNAGLIVCAVAGCGAAATGRPYGLGLAEWLLLGASALVFVAIWLQLGEIMALLGDA
jgi:hypothetical protein